MPEEIVMGQLPPVAVIDNRRRTTLATEVRGPVRDMGTNSVTSSLKREHVEPDGSNTESVEPQRERTYKQGNPTDVVNNVEPRRVRTETDDLAGMTATEEVVETDTGSEPKKTTAKRRTASTKKRASRNK